MKHMTVLKQNLTVFFKGLYRVSGGNWAQCRQVPSARLSAPLASDTLKNTWVIPKISWI